jgi:hypothetical protein
VAGISIIIVMVLAHNDFISSFGTPFALLSFFLIAFIPLNSLTKYNQVRTKWGACSITMTLDSVSIRWSKAATEVKYGWRKIAKVVHVKDETFIYIDARNAICVFDHHFPTPDDAKRFFERAESYWKMGQIEQHERHHQ